MKKILMFLSALLLWSACAVAQTTAVTATVVDSDSTVWANAPWSLSFQVGPYQSNPALYTIGGAPLDPAVTQQSGAADGSGVITFTVYRSTSVSPIGSSWNLTVCPNASSRCSSFNFSTSGSSQNLSSQINAGIIAPRFQAVSGSYGYNDGEALLQLKPASTYWNVTNSVLRCYTGSAWGVCSAGGGALPTATAKGQQLTATAAGNTYAAVNPGVINVRTMFGAIPDHSTDNSAAFAAASTILNTSASQPSSPVLFFDCDGSSTTCIYNYGGSGLSPINLQVPATIECSGPNVFLNYTGTAHALDIGETSGLPPLGDRRPFTIKNCGFMGGATYTAGIFINPGIIPVDIIGNVFFNYGNRTAATIRYSASWIVNIGGNRWLDTDGLTKNMVDGHDAAFGATDFHDNMVECADATSLGAPCSVATYGYGLYVARTINIHNNVLQFHIPNINITQVGTGEGKINHNHIEHNTFDPLPDIMFGDPNAVISAETLIQGWTIADNLFTGSGQFAPTISSIGPATPAMGSTNKYWLSLNTISHNQFGVESNGSPQVATNESISTNFFDNNQDAVGQIITWSANAPALNDAVDHQVYSLNLEAPVEAFTGSLLAIVNTPGAGATNGVALRATWANITQTLICPDTSGSGTDQSCQNGIDRFNAQAVGDMLIYKTTTTNTGALTLNFNSIGAAAVKKRQGTTALAAGDILAGHPVILIWDGTEWELTDPVVP